MKKCPKCGASLNDDDNFCLFCGARLDEENIDSLNHDGPECPYCHHPINKEDKFCQNCGMEIKGGGVEFFDEGKREDGNNSYEDEKIYEKKNESIWKTIPLFFKNIINFKGRSNNREYWFPRVIISVALTLILNFIPSNLVVYKYPIPTELLEYLGTLEDFADGYLTFDVINLVINLIDSLIFIPASCRRLRDTGKSPYYIFVSLIPLIGELYLFILLIQPTDRYRRRY